MSEGQAVVIVPEVDKGPVDEVRVISKSGGITVRHAVPDDVPGMVQMASRFIESVYVGKITKNEDSLSELGQRLVSDKSGDSLMTVVEVNGQVVGMLGAHLFTHPMSGERVASELFWWVDQNARGRAGIRLFQALEGWAEEKRADVLMLVSPDAEVARFYKALGFEAVETTYQRRLT